MSLNVATVIKIPLFNTRVLKEILSYVYERI